MVHADSGITYRFFYWYWIIINRTFRNRIKSHTNQNSVVLIFENVVCEYYFVINVNFVERYIKVNIEF